MGWKNRVFDELGVAEAAIAAVRLKMEHPLNSVGHVDLDEVVRNLLDVQVSAARMLSEIYDSCGPFFPPPKEG